MSDHRQMAQKSQKQATPTIPPRTSESNAGGDFSLRQALNHPHQARPEAILALQRTIGNQAVQRLLATPRARQSQRLAVIQREGSSEEESEESEAANPWSEFEEALARYELEAKPDTTPLEPAARQQLKEAGEDKPQDVGQGLADHFRKHHRMADAMLADIQPRITEEAKSVRGAQFQKARKSANKSTKGGFLRIPNLWNTENTKHHADKMRNVSRVEKELLGRNKGAVESYHETLGQLETYAFREMAELTKRNPNKTLQPCYEADVDLCKQINESSKQMRHWVKRLSITLRQGNIHSHPLLPSYARWQQGKIEHWRAQMDELCKQREQLKERVAREVAIVARTAEIAHQVDHQIQRDLSQVLEKFGNIFHRLNGKGELRQLFAREIKKGSHKSPKAVVAQETVKFLSFAVSIAATAATLGGASPLLVTAVTLGPNVVLSTASNAISNQSAGKKQTFRGHAIDAGTSVLAVGINLATAELGGMTKVAINQGSKTAANVVSQGIKMLDAHREAKKLGQPGLEHGQEMKKLGKTVLMDAPTILYGAATQNMGGTALEKGVAYRGYGEMVGRGKSLIPDPKSKTKEQKNPFMRKAAKKDKGYKKWSKDNHSTDTRVEGEINSGEDKDIGYGFHMLDDVNDQFDEMYGLSPLEEKDEPGHNHPRGRKGKNCPGCRRH